MVDPPHYPDTDEDTGVGADRGSKPRMPRWVKVGIIGLVLVLLLVVILALTGVNSGDPGPGGD